MNHPTHKHFPKSGRRQIIIFSYLPASPITVSTGGSLVCTYFQIKLCLDYASINFFQQPISLKVCDNLVVFSNPITDGHFCILFRLHSITSIPFADSPQHKVVGS